MPRRADIDPEVRGTLPERTRALVTRFDHATRNHAFSDSGDGTTYAEWFADLLEEWLAQAGERTRLWMNLAVSLSMSFHDEKYSGIRGECLSCHQAVHLVTENSGCWLIGGHFDPLRGPSSMCTGSGGMPGILAQVLLTHCGACGLDVLAWTKSLHLPEGAIQLSAHYVVRPHWQEHLHEGMVPCSASGRQQPASTMAGALEQHNQNVVRLMGIPPHRVAPDPNPAYVITNPPPEPAPAVSPVQHRCKGHKDAVVPGCADCLYADLTGVSQVPRDEAGWTEEYVRTGRPYAYDRMVASVTSAEKPPPAAPEKARRDDSLVLVPLLIPTSVGTLMVLGVMSVYLSQLAQHVLAAVLCVLTVLLVYFRPRRS